MTTPVDTFMQGICFVSGDNPKLGGVVEGGTDENLAGQSVPG